MVLAIHWLFAVVVLGGLAGFVWVVQRHPGAWWLYALVWPVLGVAVVIAAIRAAARWAIRHGIRDEVRFPGQRWVLKPDGVNALFARLDALWAERLKK